VEGACPWYHVLDIEVTRDGSYGQSRLTNFQQKVRVGTPSEKSGVCRFAGFYTLFMHVYSIWLTNMAFSTSLLPFHRVGASLSFLYVSVSLFPLVLTAPRTLSNLAPICTKRCPSTFGIRLDHRSFCIVTRVLVYRREQFLQRSLPSSVLYISKGTSHASRNRPTGSFSSLVSSSSTNVSQFFLFGLGFSTAGWGGA
jgi:hypothetical protein